MGRILSQGPAKIYIYTAKQCCAVLPKLPSLPLEVAERDGVVERELLKYSDFHGRCERNCSSFEICNPTLSNAFTCECPATRYQINNWNDVPVCTKNLMVLHNMVLVDAESRKFLWRPPNIVRVSSWDEAKLYCENLHTSLPTIATAEEFQRLLE